MSLGTVIANIEDTTQYLNLSRATHIQEKIVADNCFEYTVTFSKTVKFKFETLRSIFPEAAAKGILDLNNPYYSAKAGRLL